MLITTAPIVEGRPIAAYKGIVFGEVIAGINFIKDFKASISNVFGGRTQSYEEELVSARNTALTEMLQRADGIGADAIIGISFAYAPMGENGTMLMVSCSGTAVQLAN